MRQYTTILMPSDELGLDKRIYVAVPEEYDKTDKHYPVLYMHDGQNLFDDRLAYQHHGWRIFDVLESNPDLPKVIIVGIESDGMTRSDHLIPFPFQIKPGAKMIGGQADSYLRFIVETVKPYMDKTYRTRPEREHTAMMGSSFGGVNTIYAAAQFGTYFSRFASLSGAFHYGFKDPLLDLLNKTDFTGVVSLYMDHGTNETDDMEQNKKYIKSNQELADIFMSKLPSEKFRYTIIEGGRHHESDWEARFADIVRYIFAS